MRDFLEISRGLETIYTFRVLCYTKLAKVKIMRIEIRKGDMPVVIISFHTRNEKFESDYERSKFFRELHGWKQTVPRNGKRYVYERKGVLNEIPHIKVADSTFIVPSEDAHALMNYMHEWADKVECEMLNMMMRQQEFMRRLAHDQIV
jgi:hypothetical protein